LNSYTFYKVGLFRPLFFIFFLAFAGVSCEPNASSDSSNDRFDYYPSKTIINYAKGFKVEYFKSYKILEVFNLEDSTEVLQRYFLVEEGTKAPEMQAQDELIRIPLASVACLSTTQVAYLSALGMSDKISGVGYASAIKDSLLLKQISEGWTMEITRAGQLDIERVLQSNTTFLMANAFDLLSVSTLSEFDIPVILSTEYLESSPLARAEWIKFFALFFNAEKSADEYFRKIEMEYLMTKEILEKEEGKPSVMFGSFYQGSWFVPGGESLVSVLFKDAGARYIYEDQKTHNNINIDTESLMNRMENIDQWGFVLSKDGELSKSDFLAGDHRMIDLAKEVNMKYFYCNTFTSDYFGMANIQADIVLKDLGKIFHPDLFPEHQFVYFQPFKN